MTRGRTEKDAEDARRIAKMIRERAAPCVVHLEEEVDGICRRIADGCNDPSMVGPVVVRIIYHSWCIEASLCDDDRSPDVSSSGSQLFGCMEELKPLVNDLLMSKKRFIAQYGERTLQWMIRRK